MQLSRQHHPCKAPRRLLRPPNALGGALRAVSKPLRLLRRGGCSAPAPAPAPAPPAVAPPPPPPPQQDEAGTSGSSYRVIQEHAAYEAVELTPRAQRRQQQQVAPPFERAERAALGPSLAFTRHLVAASNGAAPMSARLESLCFLVFTTGREQAAALAGPPADPGTWLASPQALALLERVYALGGALADAGTDGLHGAGPGSGGAGGGGAPSSNAQRAAVALDVAGLLTRYLAQHGATLREPFVAALPHEWLQAQAVYVATRLESVSAINRVVFDRLIDRVGLEGPAGAAHHGAHAAPMWWPPVAAPAAPVTIINSAVGGGAAARSEAGASAQAASTATAPSTSGGGGPLQAIVLGVLAVGRGVVALVVAVFYAASSLVARALMLLSFLAAARAVAAFARRGGSGAIPQCGGAAAAAPQPALAGVPAGAWPGPTPGTGPWQQSASDAGQQARPAQHQLQGQGLQAFPPEQQQQQRRQQRQQEAPQQEPLRAAGPAAAAEPGVSSAGPPRAEAARPSYFDVLSPAAAAARSATAPLFAAFRAEHAPAAGPAAAAAGLPHYAALQEERRRAFGSHRIEFGGDDDPDGGW